MIAINNVSASVSESPADNQTSFRLYPSPNVDDRPDGEPIDCVVVHATVETLDDSLDILTSPVRRVSSHYVVDRDGTVYELVPPPKRAWHAGVTLFDGRERVNDFSVGIEIVNRNDGVDPFTDGQYEAVAQIIRRLRAAPYGYAIPDSRIVSHAEIALPPGRKSDPVGFDFPRLFALLDEDANNELLTV